MSDTRFDVIVIGAGANGLVAATVLARAGRRVCLLEREDAVGGQGRSIEFAPGFRVAPLGGDSGWLPPQVAGAVGLERLERVPHPAPLTLAASDGEALTLWSEPSRAAEAIRKHSAADAAQWPAFVARLRKLAGFLEGLYTIPAPDIEAPPSDWLDLLALARKFRGLGRKDMIEFLRFLPTSVWELLDDVFESGVLKAAVATGGVRDHRQGPRSGATGFVLLHYLVGAAEGMVRRVAAWRDGPDAFARAAEASARAAGVTIRTGAAVARIAVRDDAVAGVALSNGEQIAARHVLSSADPARTLLEWVDPVWLDPDFIHAARNIRFRGCTAFVLYALDALPDVPGLATPEALAGVVSLTPSLEALEKAADAAKYGRVSEPPHVEITVPSLRAAGLAPEGKHVMVARAQYAPYRLRDGAAWDGAQRDKLAEGVTTAIGNAIPCFTSRVLHRVTWTPLDLEQHFGLTEGAPTQGEMGLDQILFMRPVAGWARYAMPIDGLYLGGSGTHPGPGVLGGSGWLAARHVLADARNR